MDELKHDEIKAKFEEGWVEGKDNIALMREIHDEYIFGPVATNEHYNMDEFNAIRKEVYAEMNPVVEEELE